MTDKEYVIDANNRPDTLPDTVDALQRIMYEALAVIERKNAEQDILIAEQRATNEIIERKDKQLAEARAEIEKQNTLLEICLSLFKQQKERGV